MSNMGAAPPAPPTGCMLDTPPTSGIPLSNMGTRPPGGGGRMKNPRVSGVWFTTPSVEGLHA
jgi:hypothetical protein